MIGAKVIVPFYLHSQLIATFALKAPPFYRKLQQEKPNDVRLVALFPQSVEDSKTYLRRLGLNVPDVAEGSLASVGVSGTPTLILVNNDGVVTTSWVGRLSDDEAAKVLNRLNENVAQ